MEARKINTVQEYFQALSILHASLMLGQILIAGIIYFFANAEKEPVSGTQATGQGWVYLVGGLTIVGVLANAQLFNTRIRLLKEGNNLNTKLAGYRSALVTRYAILEFPSLIAIIAYYLTNNLLLLIFTGLIILLFFIYRPTKERLIADLELSPEEQARVSNPDTIIAD